MASNKTIGVYILAALATKFSVLAFLSVAVSTKSKILATVLSLYSLVTFTSSKPLVLMLPDSTSSPVETLVSLLSPVKALVFNLASPLTIIPSRGIFSPCLMIIISFIFTSSGSTLVVVLFSFKLAYSGLISIRSLIDFLELLMAMLSSIFPIS